MASIHVAAPLVFAGVVLIGCGERPAVQSPPADVPTTSASRSAPTASAPTPSAPVALPDTEPTMDETRQWIAERLPELSQLRLVLPVGSHTAAMITTTRAATLDTDCILTLEEETATYIDGQPAPSERSEPRIARIPLREVDANGVSASRPDASDVGKQLHPVTVPISGGRRLIQLTGVVSADAGTRQEILRAAPDRVQDADDPTRAASYPIQGRNEEAAERIARAVRRAVKLCGGRVDRF